MRIQCSNWMSVIQHDILGTEMIDREIRFSRLPIVPTTSRENEIPARPRSPQISKTVKQRHMASGEDDLQTKNEQRSELHLFHPPVIDRSFAFPEACLFMRSTKTEFIVFMFSFLPDERWWHWRGRPVAMISHCPFF
jgi:hypothetical protein